MRRALLPIALQVACAGTPSGPRSGGHEGEDTGSVPTEETGPSSGHAPLLGHGDLTPPWFGSSDGETGERPEDTGVPVEEVPGAVVSADWVYAGDRVIAVELSLSDEAMASLGDDPWTWVEGDMTFDGREFPGVGVRLKGRLGSYRDLNQKAGFKVDLGEFGAGARLDGLQKLTFSNLVQDPSFVHEPAAYAVYASLGVQVPRIGYVWLRLNGNDYGLYENVETYDDVFLKRVYAEHDGNLYDGDYWTDFAGDKGALDYSWAYVDFLSSSQELFELDEGEDVGLADIRAVTSVVEAYRSSERFGDEISLVFNWDNHLRYWSAEIWAGQYDGYSYNSNNYRVYFNPETGLPEMLPWDPDQAFNSITPLHDPVGVLSSACLDHTECSEPLLTVLADTCDLLEVGSVANEEILAEVERRIELLLPYIESDPRREDPMETVLSEQDELRAWFSTRSSTVRRSFRL